MHAREQFASQNFVKRLPICVVGANRYPRSKNENAAAWIIDLLNKGF